MEGFKNTTKTKYMTEGGTFNERGRRATMSEIAAEDRRTANRPSEGVSTRPTDSSGRRASDADLGMTTSAKKATGPSSVAVSKVLAGMTKPMKKAVGGSVSDDPVRAVRPQTTMGGPNRRQGPQPAVPSPATAKPKIGALAAGARQLMDKMKGTSKPTVTAPSTSPRDIETDDGRRAPNVVKKATGGSVSKPMGPKPAPTKGPGQPPQPPTKGTGQPRQPIKGPMGPKPAPTVGPDLNPVTKGPPTPMGYGKGGSAKKGVPAHNSRPMIGRKAGGLAVMPKGAC